MRSPEEALRTFSAAPGFRVELVASEPLVQMPVAVSFDGEGRLWVVEMRGFMPNVAAEGEQAPLGRVSVLEDVNGDGRMDRGTVFLDSLVLPRALHLVDGGALVGEPPYLWFARDTDGDLRADEKTLVSDRYGRRDANPEYNPNGLVRGMDNWIHNTGHTTRLRRVDGRWVEEPVLNLGQWGLSLDDYGRQFRVSNSQPLLAGYFDSHYLTRNPNLPAARGVEEMIAASREVWPIRATRGVNRGYRESVLRENGTLQTFTAASAPAVYRGDLFPEAFRGNVFVPEPAAYVVRRFVLDEAADGTLTADNPYEEAEFLASTDERFRPVNLSVGPDGALYVVDMYHGLLQHASYMTTYLRQYAMEHGLDEPGGLGRIWRVVPEGGAPAVRPRLPGRSTAELVRLLAHPAGWWRDMAQQQLVERGDTSAAPALRRLARDGDTAQARLHALWTLEGLKALDAGTVRRALADRAPWVRAAAVRLTEPGLCAGDATLLTAAAGLVDDPAPQVRLQAALSLGETPGADADPALVALLTRHPAQPFLTDAVISGLHGRELAFLERLLGADAWRTPSPPAGYEKVLATLSAAVVKENDPDKIDRLLAVAAEAGHRPRWQRLALLDGVAGMIPRPRRGVALPLQLKREPRPLAGLLRDADEQVRAQAQTLAEALVWPGKPQAAARVERLTDEAQALFDAGQQHYLATCAPCHQASGMGQEGLAAPLVGSDWVLGTSQNLARILLHGKEGETMMMPPQPTLTDDEIAAILTYIRNAWGNRATPVTADLVTDVRQETQTRTRPWTDEELQLMRH